MIDLERCASLPSGLTRKAHFHKGSAVFDPFEIRASRDEVRRFYRTVGKAERKASAAQAASE